MDELLEKYEALYGEIKELHIRWATEAADWVRNDPMDADVLRDATEQLRRATELASLLEKAP